jgi:hypothetical protein
MKIPYDEGLASRIGPESCVARRKAGDEALTGESVGRVLSRESAVQSGVPTGSKTWKATWDTSLTREASWPRVVEDPVHAPKLLVREPGDPTTDLERWCQGPRGKS